MNREIFMKRLTELLMDIPESERMEALQYYSDYFDDAGEDNEENVIQELESPETVAQMIQNDLSGRNREEWEYTDSGFSDSHKNPHSITVAGKNQGYAYERDYENAAKRQKKSGMDTGKVILIALLLIITSPLWLSVGGALLGIVLGAVAIVFSVLVGFFAAAFALGLAGLIVIGLTFAEFMSVPLLGIFTLGIGLLLLGIAVFFLVVGLWLFVIVLPGLVKGVRNMMKKSQNRKEGEA